MPTVALIGTLVVCLSIVCSIPQVWRTHRTRTVDGLSGGSLLLSLACFALWGSYGIASHQPVQMANNAVMLVLFGYLTYLVVRAGALATWQPLAVVAATTAVALPASLLLNPALAAAAGALLGAGMRIPQVLVARRGHSLAGLSAAGVALGLAVQVGWLTYGLVAGDGIVIASCLFSGALQLVIMHRRLPPRPTLHALAGGRLGGLPALLARPVAARFPLASA